MSFEYKLASINAGKRVEKDDITVTRFRYLLENLERKTKNNQEEIGDMSVTGVNLLRDKYGKEVKLLDFMEGTNQIIPEDENIQMDYAEIAALYLTRLKE